LFDDVVSNLRTVVESKLSAILWTRRLISLVFPRGASSSFLILKLRTLSIRVRKS